jgi:hypothetical protein
MKFSTGTGLLILPAWTALTYAANERLNLAAFGNMYNAEHFLKRLPNYNASLGRLSELIMLGKIATLYPGESLS